MNRRFLTILGLAAVLALVVSAIFYQITTSAGGRGRSKRQTKEVVVATNPLAMGSTIQSSDLKMVAWPAENIPPGSFAKIDEVVERVALSSILPEEPILAPRLAEKGSGLGLSPMIPSGMRAVSVRVNDVISVAGFVLPGSKVDVLVTGVPRGVQTQTGPVTRTVLANIQVLSAGKNIQTDGKGQPENVAVVTLLVTPEQAEVLTLASNEGRIQLALRNNIDTRSETGGGAMATQLFAASLPPVEPAKPAPRPRLVTARLPPLAPPVIVEPPPPPPRIELIRGEKKSTEVILAVDR